MSENWLQAFLVDSIERNLCTKIHCTTCGASEFRRGLQAALAGASDHAPLHGPIHGTTELAEALAQVMPVARRERDLEAAVRFILFDVSRSHVSPSELEGLLSGTWAGEILGGMQAHHSATTAAARERRAFEDPANVRKRRVEKKRLRQEQHLDRLAKQAERGRLWHASHEGEIDSGRVGERVSSPPRRLPTVEDMK